MTVPDAGATPQRGLAATLAVAIVSWNSSRWLEQCLPTVFAAAGGLTLDVVIADNDSTDGTAELLEREFPSVRVLRGENKGFAYGNNRALETCDARYVLFLNPDTEILRGTFKDLVLFMDENLDIGLLGVRQVGARDELLPTIRRFPSAGRTLAEAFGSERLPAGRSWPGERDRAWHKYDLVRQCDWTSGSFMLVRREAIESAGQMDERFFLYCEEPDLSLRMKRRGWRTVHVPFMEIRHHGGSVEDPAPVLSAQEAISRRAYARKHMSALPRLAFYSALVIGWALRSLRRPGARREAARRALKAFLGLEPPPFGGSSSALGRAGSPERDQALGGSGSESPFDL